LKLAERVDALAGLSGGASEFQEAEARVEHLAQQVADLEQAEHDLRELVERLGSGISERFKVGFAAINQSFDGYFRQLFGGGKAALKLDEVDGGHGIDLSVALPGKRTGNLSSLSGGERALTGVALLAALLTQSRSPFIVLDEVDAALDEANSSRFSEVLAELGQKSQLIVVTHNRQTMGAAKNLYGVTLDRHNLSRVVSLRLDQARQLAARG
jgi:chromosome segregation protein